VRVASPVPSVQVVAPAPVVRVAAPTPQSVQTVQATSRNSGSVGDLFGDGNFNVRFNTPDFQIEY